jgi:hypothetical protein
MFEEESMKHQMKSYATVALALGATSLWMGLASNLSIVLAGVPSGVPVFTHPLTITNRFNPFQSGGMKVYTGTKDGAKSVIVDLYLSNTRSFTWSNTTAQCHIVQEVEFSNGMLVEISKNHLAQADDGTLYYFGEIVDEYEGGVITSHDGSWLVGGATLGGVPTNTATAVGPTVFMPANPQVGDVFKQEDLLPIVDETDTVQRVGLAFTVPAGKYTNAIQVLESSALDKATETKWYAPGVGAVKGHTKGESFQLISSTLIEP